MASKSKSGASDKAAHAKQAAGRKAGAKKAPAKAAMVQKSPVRADKPGQDDGSGRPHADAVAGQSAREVFETLARWRSEMATAAEAMTPDFALGSGADGAAMAALLAGQRRVLAEIEATLAQVQELIARAERQLEADSGAETARLPLGLDAGLPLAAALQGVQLVQQMSASNLSLWAKLVQDCQAMWLEAMQTVMPAAGQAAAQGGKADGTLPARSARNAS